MRDEMTIKLKKEDGDWLAFYPDYPNISAYGDTPSEAVYELGVATQAMEESYRKHDEKIPWEEPMSEEGK